MVDYGAAIKRPFSDWKKLLIGAFIIFISSVVALVFGKAGYDLLAVVFIVTLLLSFIIRGYYARCAITVLKKSLKLPGWEKIGNLISRGFFISLLMFIYGLPALLVLVLAGGSAFIEIFTALAQGAVPSFEAMGNFWRALVPSVLLMILASYLIPVAIMGYLKKNRFGAAFNIGEVFRKAFTGPYIISILVIIAYAVGVMIVAGLLSLILGGITTLLTGTMYISTIIGYAISALASIIITITAYTIFAETYLELK